MSYQYRVSRSFLRGSFLVFPLRLLVSQLNPVKCKIQKAEQYYNSRVDGVEQEFVSTYTGQEREPEDWAEYSDKHDTVTNPDLVFQVVFAVSDQSVSCSSFTSQELQDLFANHRIGTAGEQVPNESENPLLLFRRLTGVWAEDPNHGTGTILSSLLSVH
jgi:hypothetical protein